MQPDLRETANYAPGVFAAEDLESARRIILTDEEGITSDERWRMETPYLLSLIEKHCPLTAESVVLDYGCGIGRLARELIERYNCLVIGADISIPMQALAVRYVKSGRFLVCAPTALPALGRCFDLALGVWVFQHALHPARDLDRVRAGLKEDARIFIVNEQRRCVPTDKGWVDDSEDVMAMLATRFACQIHGRMDPEVVTPEVAERTFWGVWHR